MSRGTPLGDPQQEAVSRRCHKSFLESLPLFTTRGVSMIKNLRAAAFGVAFVALAGAAGAQEITGAGATFPAPLYAKWAADYNKATGVKINYQSVGSGAGIRQIDAKTVAFGASDMPLKDEELAKKGQLQFPTVIGG